MSDEEPVVIATFVRAMYARLAQTALAEEGIEAHVVDENVATALPYLHVVTGGVKVIVRPVDADRAGRVVGELRAEWEHGAVLGGGADWTCPKCSEGVPSEHDVCWSCGTERAEVRALAGSPEPPPAPEADGDSTRETEQALEAEMGRLDHKRDRLASAALLYFLVPLGLALLMLMATCSGLS